MEGSKYNLGGFLFLSLSLGPGSSRVHMAFDIKQESRMRKKKRQEKKQNKSKLGEREEKRNVTAQYNKQIMHKSYVRIIHTYLSKYLSIY